MTIAEDTASPVVCRHCRRTITEQADGRWADETGDPLYCPSAVAFGHAPAPATTRG